MAWALVAREGTRALYVDPASRYRPEPSDPGHLVKAAVQVGDDWGEQTIWEPNLLARKPETIAHRLRDWPAERITPQKVTG